jgi:hypothetical protein
MNCTYKIPETAINKVHYVFHDQSFFSSLPIYSKTEDGQTPCHAAALGGRTPTFPSAISTTRNPLKGIYYCSKGVFSFLSHYLRDSQLQRRILEYLVIYGGDLRVQSLTRETPRDIAVRRRMMDVVRMIEEYCKQKLLILMVH